LDAGRIPKREFYISDLQNLYYIYYYYYYLLYIYITICLKIVTKNKIIKYRKQRYPQIKSNIKGNGYLERV